MTVGDNLENLKAKDLPGKTTAAAALANDNNSADGNALLAKLRNTASSASAFLPSDFGLLDNTGSTITTTGADNTTGKVQPVDKSGSTQGTVPIDGQVVPTKVAPGSDGQVQPTPLSQGDGKTPRNVTDGKTPANLSDGKTPANLSDGRTLTSVNDGRTPANVNDGRTQANVNDGRLGANVVDNGQLGAGGATGRAATTEVTGRAGTTEVTGRAGTTEVTGRAGTTEVTGRAGTTEVTGRTGTAEVTGRTGTTEVTGRTVTSVVDNGQLTTSVVDNGQVGAGGATGRTSTNVVTGRTSTNEVTGRTGTNLVDNGRTGVVDDVRTGTNVVAGQTVAGGDGHTTVVPSKAHPIEHPTSLFATNSQIDDGRGVTGANPIGGDLQGVTPVNTIDDSRGAAGGNRTTRTIGQVDLASGGTGQVGDGQSPNTVHPAKRPEVSTLPNPTEVIASNTAIVDQSVTGQASRKLGSQPTEISSTAAVIPSSVETGVGNGAKARKQENAGSLDLATNSGATNGEGSQLTPGQRQRQSGTVDVITNANLNGGEQPPPPKHLEKQPGTVDLATNANLNGSEQPPPSKHVEKQPGTVELATNANLNGGEQPPPPTRHGEKLPTERQPVTESTANLTNVNGDGGSGASTQANQSHEHPGTVKLAKTGGGDPTIGITPIEPSTVVTATSLEQPAGGTGQKHSKTGGMDPAGGGSIDHDHYQRRQLAGNDQGKLGGVGGNDQPTLTAVTPVEQPAGPGSIKLAKSSGNGELAVGGTPSDHDHEQQQQQLQQQRRLLAGNHQGRLGSGVNGGDQQTLSAATPVEQPLGGANGNGVKLAKSSGAGGQGDGGVGGVGGSDASHPTLANNDERSFGRHGHHEQNGDLGGAQPGIVQPDGVKTSGTGSGGSELALNEAAGGNEDRSFGRHGHREPNGDLGGTLSGNTQPDVVKTLGSGGSELALNGQPASAGLPELGGAKFGVKGQTGEAGSNPVLTASTFNSADNLGLHSGRKLEGVLDPGANSQLASLQPNDANHLVRKTDIVGEVTPPVGAKVEPTLARIDAGASGIKLDAGPLKTDAGLPTVKAEPVVLARNDAGAPGQRLEPTSITGSLTGPARNEGGASGQKLEPTSLTASATVLARNENGAPPVVRTETQVVARNDALATGPKADPLRNDALATGPKADPLRKDIQQDNPVRYVASAAGLPAQDRAVIQPVVQPLKLNSSMARDVVPNEKQADVVIGALPGAKGSAQALPGQFVPGQVTGLPTEKGTAQAMPGQMLPGHITAFSAEKGIGQPTALQQASALHGEKAVVQPTTLPTGTERAIASAVIQPASVLAGDKQAASFAGDKTVAHSTIAIGPNGLPIVNPLATDKQVANLASDKSAVHITAALGPNGIPAERGLTQNIVGEKQSALGANALNSLGDKQQSLSVTANAAQMIANQFGTPQIIGTESAKDKEKLNTVQFKLPEEKSNAGFETTTTKTKPNPEAPFSNGQIVRGVVSGKQEVKSDAAPELQPDGKGTVAGAGGFGSTTHSTTGAPLPNTSATQPNGTQHGTTPDPNDPHNAVKHLPGGSSLGTLPGALPTNTSGKGVLPNTTTTTGNGAQAASALQNLLAQNNPTAGKSQVGSTTAPESATRQNDPVIKATFGTPIGQVGVSVSDSGVKVQIGPVSVPISGGSTHQPVSNPGQPTSGTGTSSHPAPTSGTGGTTHPGTWTPGQTTQPVTGIGSTTTPGGTVQPTQGAGTTSKPTSGTGSTVQPTQGPGSTVQPTQGSGSTIQPPQGSVSTVLPTQGSGSTGQPAQGTGSSTQGQAPAAPKPTQKQENPVKAGTGSGFTVAPSSGSNGNNGVDVSINLGGSAGTVTYDTGTGKVSGTGEAGLIAGILNELGSSGKSSGSGSGSASGGSGISGSGTTAPSGGTTSGSHPGSGSGSGSGSGIGISIGPGGAGITYTLPDGLGSIGVTTGKNGTSLTGSGLIGVIENMFGNNGNGSVTITPPSNPSNPGSGGGTGGGTSPGSGGTSPGSGGTSPGSGGTSPGSGGTSPGSGGTSPGSGGTSPGIGGTSPGSGGTSPGSGGTSPGSGGTAPSDGGTTNPPGNGGTTDPPPVTGTGTGSPTTGGTDPGGSVTNPTGVPTGGSTGPTDPITGPVGSDPGVPSSITGADPLDPTAGNTGSPLLSGGVQFDDGAPGSATAGQGSAGQGATGTGGQGAAGQADPDTLPGDVATGQSNAGLAGQTPGSPSSAGNASNGQTADPNSGGPLTGTQDPTNAGTAGQSQPGANSPAGQPSTDTNGNPVGQNQSVDPNGNPVGQNQSVDPNGNPVGQNQSVDPNGNPVGQNQSVDPNGNPVAQNQALDPNGNATGLPQQNADPNGNQVGQQPQSVDANGNPIQQTVDANGNPVQQTADANGNPIQQTVDAKGNPMPQTVDANGNPVSQAVDANGNPIPQAVDANGNPIPQTVDSNGTQVQQTIDANGNLVQQPVDASGNPVGPAQTFDPNGNLIPQTVDANGNLVQQTIDANGNLVQQPVDASGNPVGPPQTFDANGNLIPQMASADGSTPSVVQHLGDATRGAFNPDFSAVGSSGMSLGDALFNNGSFGQTPAASSGFSLDGTSSIDGTASANQTESGINASHHSSPDQTANSFDPSFIPGNLGFPTDQSWFTGQSGIDPNFVPGSGSPNNPSSASGNYADPNFTANGFDPSGNSYDPNFVAGGYGLPGDQSWTNPQPGSADPGYGFGGPLDPTSANASNAPYSAGTSDWVNFDGMPVIGNGHVIPREDEAPFAGGIQASDESSHGPNSDRIEAMNPWMSGGTTADEAIDLISGRAKDDYVDSAFGLGLQTDGGDLIPRDDSELEARMDKERQDLEQNLADRISAEQAEADRQQKQAEQEAQQLTAMLMAQEEERERADNKQEQYKVQPGDTLEAISMRHFREPGIAALIYELNKTKIIMTVVNGNAIYELKPGCVLTLPSPKQIREWKQRKSYEQTVAAAGLDQAQPQPQVDERRSNIEKYLGPIAPTLAPVDGRQKLMVRLGDTVRSVSMKHPALNDVSLWKLVAEVNKLPTNVDAKGVPVAELRRGTSIVIPSKAEIAEYRLRVSTTGSRSSYTAPSSPPVVHPSTVPSRPVASTEHEKSGMAVIQGNKGQPTFSLTSQNLDATEQEWVQNTIMNSLVEKLGDSCRIVKSTVEVGVSQIVRSQLEVMTGDIWVPILSYEICDNASVRYTHTPDGQRKSMPIDLPASAVNELMTNDLHSNWKDYAKKYLKQKGA